MTWDVFLFVVWIYIYIYIFIFFFCALWIFRPLGALFVEVGFLCLAALSLGLRFMVFWLWDQA